MTKDVRFILGLGEKLTSGVDVPRGGGEKSRPYTLNQSLKALMPLFARAIESVQEIPAEACPGDNAVAAVTLHPAFLAKSYFPQTLLKEANLTPVSSKARTVLPRSAGSTISKQSGAGAGPGVSEGLGMVTTQLFVAGKRKDIAALPSRLSRIKEGSTLADDIAKVEDFRVPTAAERVRLRPGPDEDLLLEVVLHTTRNHKMQQMVFEGFEAYARTLDLDPDFDRRFEREGLCFLSLRAARDQVTRIAEFTFLRVAREMPRLRQFRPFFPRNLPGMEAFPVRLPASRALDDKIRVAVFDGGLPENHGLDRWVNVHDAPGVGAAVPEYQGHGMAVTSAVLFGPLDEDAPLEVPPAGVDHYCSLCKSATAAQGRLSWKGRGVRIDGRSWIIAGSSIGCSTRKPARTRRVSCTTSCIASIMFSRLRRTDS